MHNNALASIMQNAGCRMYVDECDKTHQLCSGPDRCIFPWWRYPICVLGTKCFDSIVSFLSHGKMRKQFQMLGGQYCCISACTCSSCGTQGRRDADVWKPAFPIIMPLNIESAPDKTAWIFPSRISCEPTGKFSVFERLYESNTEG